MKPTINQFKILLQNKQIQDEIKLTQMGLTINAELTQRYLSHITAFDFDHFRNIIKLNVCHSHQNKLDTLAEVDTGETHNLLQNMHDYSQFAADLKIPKVNKEGTGFVGVSALRYLNMRAKSMSQDLFMPMFLEAMFALLQSLIKTPNLSDTDAHQLYLSHLKDVHMPKGITVKTLCTPLFSLNPQAFPLINTYIEKQLVSMLGPFHSDAEGYIDVAQQSAGILKELGVDPVDFSVLDRLLSNIGHAELDEEPSSTHEPEIPNLTLTEKKHSLNTLLYGPPGTGKTYHCVQHAIELIEPEFMAHSPTRAEIKARYDHWVALGHIQTVTFHQSFSYEDFIEGIRAEADEQGQIRYEVQDGVFKRLCLSAQAKSITHPNARVTLNDKNVWKMSLGNTLEDDDSIYQECLEKGYILLGYGENHDISKLNSKEGIKKYLESSSQSEISSSDYTLNSLHMFKHTMKTGDLVVVSDGNHKFRAIGEITGEYAFLNHPEHESFQQMRKVNWLRVYEPSLPKEQLINKAFSQMTLYQLKPHVLNLDKLNALLQPKTSQAPYVLIIDEINRGNISSIFGELMTLIETGKRLGQSEAMRVTLPYSKEEFGVPDNVYILGTMNTADRSLTGLDNALRRRFAFQHMPPKPQLLSGIEIEGIPISDLLVVLNQRIEVLLDTDHCLGHSYFLPLKSQPQLSRLAHIFENQIIPLLQEYFFDDWQRIHWVLNDHRKSETHFQFVQKKELDLERLFGDDFETHSRPVWKINTKAFEYAESFLEILTDL